ncbi:MAG: hypothetical protein QOF41_62 [Methylobacteriaceae bacterium]|nr:hypothetical protein [Methylobacteriaceae bacterium]
MTDYYLSGTSNTGEQLIIAPISDEVAAAQNITDSESIGYFLYQKNNAGDRLDISILAKVTSEEAAFELGRILNLK